MCTALFYCTCVYIYSLLNSCGYWTLNKYYYYHYHFYMKIAIQDYFKIHTETNQYNASYFILTYIRL